MKNHKLKDEEITKGKISPMAVAVAGAVVGAGIAVAGVVLADEKNREKMKKAAITVKNGAVEYIENAQKQAEIKKNELEKRILADKEKVRKVVSSAKDSIDKTTKEVNKAVKSL